MSLVVQVLAWIAVALVLLVLLAAAWWVVDDRLAARRDEPRRREQLERALSRTSPWITVPVHKAPSGLDTCSAVAAESGYRVLGIERSRGPLRRPQLVFVPRDGLV